MRAEISLCVSSTTLPSWSTYAPESPLKVWSTSRVPFSWRPAFSTSPAVLPGWIMRWTMLEASDTCAFRFSAMIERRMVPVANPTPTRISATKETTVTMRRVCRLQRCRARGASRASVTAGAVLTAAL